MTLTISEAAALGLPLDLGTVLEVRNVSTALDGTIMEWRRVITEPNKDSWKPFVIYPDGREVSPFWMPLPGSQMAFLQCPAPEALYSGNRGGGKSIILLQDFAKDVGKGWGKAWRGILFRKSFGDLDDIVQKIEEHFYPMFPGFRFLKSKAEYTAVWPDGEQLLLRHMRDENDYSEYHGHSYDIPYGEVLTVNKGWVSIADIAIGEEIYSVSKDRKLVKTNVAQKVEYDYTGELCVVDGRGVHMALTPQHAIAVVDDNGEISSTPYEDLGSTEHVARWVDFENSEDLEAFTFPEVEYRTSRKGGVKNPITIKGDDYAEFMGWFLSEGSIRRIDGKSNFGPFSLCQEKEPNRAKIRNLLDRMDLTYCETGSDFVTYAPRWYEYLKQFGNCREKFVPDTVKNFSKRQLAIFFSALTAGDGTYQGDNAYYHTTSKKLADDVAEIAFKLGYAVYVSSRQRPNRDGLSWTIACRAGKRRDFFLRTDNRERNVKHVSTNVKRVPYVGKTYCIGVPQHHTFVVRQNGCVWVSGNCWIGWEELTQWENSKAYLKMMSCNRPTRPGIPLRVRSTTNPCVDEGEVLTPKGWVDIKDMKLGDEVFSFDKKGMLRTSRVNGVFESDFDGELVRREGRGLYMSMTPNHRLPKVGGNRKNRGNTRNPEEAVDLTLTPFDELPGQASILRAVSGWQGTRIDKFTVLESERKRTTGREPVLEVSGDDYATFMGWFLSEGSCVLRDRAFDIAQMKEENRPKIAGVLLGMGFEHQGWTAQSVRVHSPEWFDYLSQFGLCRDKFIPVQLKNASVEQLRLFFDAAMAGDGHWANDGGGQYYTTSKQLADDMTEVAVKLGYAVYLSNRQRDNRVGLSYCVNFSSRKMLTLNTGNHLYDVATTSKTNVERVPYIGKVYCIGVEEDETFVIRQKGCVWLSGNSGVGHGWVKKRFQLPGNFGKVIREPMEMPRVAIHGDLAENFILLHADPTYPDKIRQAASNPQEAEAWLAGSWEITTGGMFDDLWNARVHVVPNLPLRLIPPGWKFTRSYDHGQAHPFACLWWVESNGEPVEYQGRYYGGIRGDLFLFAEWYGCNGEENVGIRMPARQIARGIRDRQEDYGIDRRTMPGPADTEIYNKDSNRMGRSPADDMEDEGVLWERADKSAGSRRRGFELLRTLLGNSLPHPDGTRDKAGLFVFQRCKWWIDLVPTAPRSEKDPDDVPDKYPDHLPDATRYRVSWTIPGMWRRSGF